MRKSSMALLAAAAIMSLTSEAASAGTVSTLYLTSVGFSNYAAPKYDFAALLGDTIINHWASETPGEFAISVYGDVRAFDGSSIASQYTLGGGFTGTSYVTTNSGAFYDATTDGTYNYLIEGGGPAGVYRTGRDYTNWTRILNLGYYASGITYDAIHHSLWVIDNYGSYGNGLVEYAMDGTVIKAFAGSGMPYYAFGLALDPGDQTLWITSSANLYQYSQEGTLLGTVSLPGGAYGAEFNLASDLVAPEPGTMAMTGAFVLLFLSQRRRLYRR